jgi:hypothetical protein
MSAASGTGQPVSNMTDITICLRAAADCLAAARFCPSVAESAREYAAMAVANLSPDHAAQVERALDCGDHRMLDDLANALEPPAAPARNPKRQRKPRVHTLIKQAEKSGKPVTSITTPDGVTLHFGKGESTEASNPWLDDLNKGAKQ